MNYENIKNNYAEISGRIETAFIFSHEVLGEKFYRVRVRVRRNSEASDVIPLLFSERIIDVGRSCIGRMIRVSGQFRSFNWHNKEKSHLVLHLFVKAYAFVTEEEARETNEIYLDGFVCKDPVYRITPRGKHICDLLLAVNRVYSRSDYIPCICWARNAGYAAGLPVGGRVRLWGRIQSRIYHKQVSEGHVVDRETYEVSVTQMEYVSEAEGYYSAVADSSRGVRPLLDSYEDDRYKIGKERNIIYEDSAGEGNQRLSAGGSQTQRLSSADNLCSL